MGQHTIEKIGGTSMSRFGEVMKNVIIGSRKGAELYNRAFVVSAYSGITNGLLEDKKPGRRASTDTFSTTAKSGKTRWKKSGPKCWNTTGPSNRSDWM